MQCPVCQGEMWDNRAKKKTASSPDYKCKNKECKYQLDPITGKYVPGDYVTSIWLKKELDRHETQMQKDLHNKVTDPFILGKEKNTEIMVKGQLMASLNDAMAKLGAFNPDDVITAFEKEWKTISQ